MTSHTSIVWFRHDFRLQDNPALVAAVQRGGPVIAVFIWSPTDEGKWAPGAASRWWLHHSLLHLKAALQQYGSRLIVRQGSSQETLLALVRDTGADAVFWNRRHEPEAARVEETLLTTLAAAGIAAESFHAGLLSAPWQVHRKDGQPFQMFTPFWKACLAGPQPPLPLPPPHAVPSPSRWPETLPLEALELEPTRDWTAGFRTVWSPGAAGAWGQVERMLDEVLAHYPVRRDRPDLLGTSRLSPHLHFGEISPRQLWYAIDAHATIHVQPGMAGAASALLRQVYWREFAHYLLWHFPHTPDQPLRSEFARFPWRNDAASLRAWQHGRTGYPLVDAGMHELWTTGWMHNRMRLVAASFLVKHLLIPWQRGAEWFWDTLVDADLANNTLGWQWTAGCGADAAPYFRIFNPVLQGEKFDPHGHYVRRWVPALQQLPNAWIHKPWQAPSSVLKAAGVVLGKTYPRPIVDHAQARQRALAALQQMKG